MSQQEREVDAARVLWIEALESGDYEQTRGVLRSQDGENTDCPWSYCCLGVMCDLYDSLKWESDTMARSIYGGSSEFPPKHVLDAHGLTLYDAEDLAVMNDDGESFESIARHLRQLFDIPKEDA